MHRFSSTVFLVCAALMALAFGLVGCDSDSSTSATSSEMPSVTGGERADNEPAMSQTRAGGTEVASDADATSESGGQPDAEDAPSAGGTDDSSADDTTAVPSEMPSAEMPAAVVVQAEEPRIEGQANLQGAAEDGHGGIRVESINTAHAAVTTSTGRFSLVVRPGTHILRFSRDGYGGVQVEVPELAAGDVHRLDDVVVLAAQPGEVRGQVVLPGSFRNADRLATVVVSLLDAQDPQADPVQSSGVDQQGTFILDDVAPGEYTLRVGAEGFVTQNRSVSLNPGERLSLPAFVLSLAADNGLTAIEGTARLQGASEDGHGGIRVESVGTPFATVTTGAGRFQLGVIAGAHTLRFTRGGYGSASVEIAEVTQGEVYTLLDEIVLAGQPGEIRGAVLFPAGLTSSDLRANVSVELYGPDADTDAEEPLQFVSLDNQNRFRLTDVAPGEYVVKATGEGFRDNLRPVDVAAGEILDIGDVVLTLPEPDVFRTTAVEGIARLAGITDDNGHGGIRVESVGTPFATVTTSEGRFFLSLTPGEHSLQFSLNGYGVQSLQVADVPQGETYALFDEVLLTSNPGQIRGIVVLPAGFTNEVLDTVIIEVHPVDAAPDAEALGIASVNRDGTFIIDSIPPGDYVVSAQALGFGITRRYTQVSPGEIRRLGDVLLTVESGADAVPARVRGVVERDGALDGEHGNIEVRALGTPFRTQSAPNGFFEIEVIPGSYTLEFTYPGYAVSQFTVADVTESEQRALEEVIEVQAELSVISGEVTLNQFGSDGRLAAVDLRLLRLDGVQDVSTAQPTLEGSFTIDSVSPGNYTLVVGGSGYVEKRIEVTVEPGSRVEVEPVALDHESVTDKAVMLTGQVQLAGQADHSGVSATVFFVGREFVLGTVQTDAEGLFEIEASGKDAYIVEFSALTRDEGTYEPPSPIGPLKYRPDLEAFIDPDLRPVQTTMQLALVDAGGDDDGDGVVNGEDNCRGSANADQLDLDGDGIGDICDSDRDGDGLLQQEEVSLGTNPDNPDSDGDGLGDLLEARGQTFPMNDDSDGDGLTDGEEMPDPANPADTDGDGNFDAIESLLADTDGDGANDQIDGPGPAGDLDGDGILNGSRGLDGQCIDEGGCDLCPTVADPEQGDKDGDGRGDACDLFDDTEEAAAPPQCTVTPNPDTTVTILCEGEAPVVVGQPEDEQGACYRCVGVDPFFVRCAQVVVNSVSTRICTDGLGSGTIADEDLICKTRADCCEGAGRAFEGGVCGACLPNYLTPDSEDDEPTLACLAPDECGNGLIEDDEACDDGNAVDDDGCTDCVVDDGMGCLGEPSICVSEPTTPEGYVLISPAVSGDGNLDAFAMGSAQIAPGRHDDEASHSVYLTRGFFMKKTEVTKAEWETHFAAGAYTPRPELDCPNCPVAGLNFYNAVLYANKVSASEGLDACYILTNCTGNEGQTDFACEEVEVNTESKSPYDCFGYRLPTEAEWAFAARGGSTSTLPAGEPELGFGDDINDDGNLDDLFAEFAILECASAGDGQEIGGPAYADINDCFHFAQSGDDKVEVKGSRAANAFGLYDMMGNVSEWVWDRYAPFGTNTKVDPIGAQWGFTRVIRGGSYLTQRNHIRVAFRSAALPTATMAPAFHDGIGFRLARSNAAIRPRFQLNLQADAGTDDERELDENGCWAMTRATKRVTLSSGEAVDPTTALPADRVNISGRDGDGDGAYDAVNIRQSEAIADQVSAGDGDFDSSTTAIAKAAAVNASLPLTGVTASIEPTVMTASLPITAVTLDSSNYITINGVAITGIRVLDNDGGEGPLSTAAADAARGVSISGLDFGIQNIAQGAGEELGNDDLIINGIGIRSSVAADDVLSTVGNASSAIAKAAAINNSTTFTGVRAVVQATIAQAQQDIATVTLDSVNNIVINGVVMTGFVVEDNDAGPGPVSDDPADARRMAIIRSQDFGHENIEQGPDAALADGDLIINDIDIRPSVAQDDVLSTADNASSAIAKAAAINTSTEFTGVTAYVEPTIAQAGNHIGAVALDDANYLQINGVIIQGVTVLDNDAGENLINAINEVSATTGVTADIDEEHQLVLTAADGRNIDVFVKGNATQLGLLNMQGAINFGGTIRLESEATMFVTSDSNALEKIGIAGNDHIFGALRADGQDNLRSYINHFSGDTGVVASLDEDNRLRLVAEDGRNIEITAFGEAANLGLVAVSGASASATAALQLSSESWFGVASQDEGGLAALGFAGPIHTARATQLVEQTYLFCDQPATYENAQTHCQEMGGSLVGVDTLAENDWVWMGSKQVRVGQTWWVGHEFIDGRWVRADGLPTDIDNLSASGAQNLGDCAAMTAETGQWSRAQCASAYRYVCAID